MHKKKKKKKKKKQKKKKTRVVIVIMNFPAAVNKMFDPLKPGYISTHPVCA